MPRPSARPQLIQAALEVVNLKGISALTLDAVAEQAGLTKRGLIYHFASKHDLLVGVHEYLAAQLESDLLTEVGSEPSAASLQERTRAYVEVALRGTSTTEMRLIMEAAHEADFIAPWSALYQRWFPEDSTPIAELDDISRRCLAVRMAADGAWSYNCLPENGIDEASRRALLTEILSMLP